MWFSLFSENLDIDTKKKMVEKIKLLGNNWDKRSFKFIGNPEKLIELNIDQFVTEETMAAMQHSLIDVTLLNIDVESWDTSTEYKKAYDIVKSIQVVNDTAERCVHTVSLYNKFGPQNENQKQLIIKNTIQHRKKIKYPSKENIKNFLEK